MTYDNSWIDKKCDRYDYLMSVFSGITTGMIDIFFVSNPASSPLGNFTDQQVDSLVKKFAKYVGWNPHKGKEDSIASAIGFLEKKFVVNYDQAHTTAVGGTFNMAPINHHFKSLSHCPDIIGLFFSILDQFQGKSTFLNNGNLIRIDTETQSLYGSNIIQKIFCGFYNWLGHIISDIAGSSGSRGNLNSRGSGVPIPFMELFQLCDFGSFQVKENRYTLAEVMVQVFQQGYDFRFGLTMSIPVVLNELIIRMFWVIRQRFFYKRDWVDCIPTEKYSNLRMMLIVGHATFCAIDGTDAFIRSQGNIVLFILKLNIIGWLRFILLIFKELRIRYGDKIQELLSNFLKEIRYILSYKEYKLINDYNKRITEFDQQMNTLFIEFVKSVEEEYKIFQTELHSSFDSTLSLEEQFSHSVKVAKFRGVSDNKIIKSKKELDDFFLK